MASGSIYATRTVSGNQPVMARRNEKSAQTFILGVPVSIDQTVGAVKEWDGVTLAAGIAGISKENASNLAVTGTAQFISIPGGVPNQPNAQKIVRGSPYNDGRLGFEVASPDTVFWGQVGPAQVTAATDITKQYGLTKDTDGHWFVDKTKVGGNAVLEVVKLDDQDTARGVYFVFLPAAIQQLA